MSFKKNVLVFALFLIASSAQAELATSNNNPQAENQVRECSSYTDFKLAPRGSVCITSKGGKFKTVANGIQDIESGLIVSNEMKFMIYDEAISYCEQKGQRLPTNEELLALINRGLEDAYGRYMAYLWSSSVRPDNDDGAYAFDVQYGFASFGDRFVRGRHGYAVSALCLSDVDVK